MKFVLNQTHYFSNSMPHIQVSIIKKNTSCFLTSINYVINLFK